MKELALLEARRFALNMLAGLRGAVRPVRIRYQNGPGGQGAGASFCRKERSSHHNEMRVGITARLIARATTGTGCVRGSRREERAPRDAREDRSAGARVQIEPTLCPNCAQTVPKLGPNWVQIESKLSPN